jgi:hypothetical protein
MSDGVTRNEWLTDLYMSQESMRINMGENKDLYPKDNDMSQENVWHCIIDNPRVDNLQKDFKNTKYFDKINEKTKEKFQKKGLKPITEQEFEKYLDSHSKTKKIYKAAKYWAVMNYGETSYIATKQIGFNTSWRSLLLGGFIGTGISALKNQIKGDVALYVYPIGKTKTNDIKLLTLVANVVSDKENFSENNNKKL